MFGMPATIRVFVAVPAADLRKGYDGLARLARDVVEQDPLSGHLFVFANRKRNRIKILYWDRDGYAVWMKRLSQGRFPWWPSAGEASGNAQRLVAHQLSVLLAAGDPTRTLKKR
jgi:transposase